MESRRPIPAGWRRWLYSLRFALAICFVASLMPVWAVYWFGDWEKSVHRVSFWEMLWSSPQASERLTARQFWIVYYGPQIAAMAAVFGVSLWVCQFIGWIREIGATKPSRTSGEPESLFRGIPPWPGSD